VGNTAMSELEQLICFVVATFGGSLTLRELLESFGVVKGLEPATVHDALNNLLASGRLVLGLDGKYSKPV